MNEEWLIFKKNWTISQKINLERKIDTVLEEEDYELNDQVEEIRLEWVVEFVDSARAEIEFGKSEWVSQLYSSSVDLDSAVEFRIVLY